MGRWLVLAVAAICAPATPDETFVKLPDGHFVGLSTTGRTAFRVRLVKEKSQRPLASPMVGPENADADFQQRIYGSWTGITASFGSIVVSAGGVLQLRSSGGSLLTQSLPLVGLSNSLSLSTKVAEVYGHGSSRQDAGQLTSNGSLPVVANTATYVPYYYSLDGYAALGVANGKTEEAYYPASYRVSVDANQIVWRFSGDFELYLMPAATLRESSVAYFGLTGRPRIPPLYAFGFIASRWGWEDKAYIEDTLTRFRAGKFPLDAIVMDFEWFTNETDYPYTPEGKPYYNDFGWNPKLWPSPHEQIDRYHRDFNVRIGLLRKPRIGNTEMLHWLRSQGYITPAAEPSGTWPRDFKHAYAEGRGLDFAQEAVRAWYSRQMAPLLEAGVDFWWNDEGEESFFTFYWWNVAEVALLRSKNLTRRFFSLNRIFSPGMARLGAAAWTGDLNPTWEDLGAQPGMVQNWVLAGQPYVANDIGGFTGNSTPEILTRWMQLGVLMPLMRTHSTCSPWATPHWPWLWGEQAAAAIRQALELRYRLLPYHYSLAHRLFATGELWMRPLAMDFPNDPEAHEATGQWMDGDILAAPVLREDSERKIYIPEGSWYSLRASVITQAPSQCDTCYRTLYRPQGLRHRSVDLIEGPVHMGGKADYAELPAFVRAGTVLPLAPVLEYSDALPGGPLEVQVYSGADGSFDLIEDDGETLAYEDGHARTTRLRWDDEKWTLNWEVQGHLSAAGKRAFTQLRVVMFSGRTSFITSEVRDFGTGGSIRIHSEGQLSEHVV